MHIVINGTPYEMPENTTLMAMMQKLGIEAKVMAAAVNMEIVKKDKWEHFAPVDGDKIELLHFVGGG
ncbi:MAG: hypothetical protein KU37_11005 [Sulfuricurvum sp. PC08-66]|nr:MAG: hypothetical protein KU37_11005 [Sulfuricurvum sp. PC08-66]